MKQKTLIRMIFALLVFMVMTGSYAMMSAGTPCPDHLKVEVVKIQESEGPVSAKSLTTIKFKALETLRGNITDEVDVKISSFSTLKFSEGKTYEISLRDKKLCQVIDLEEVHEH